MVKSSGLIRHWRLCERLVRHLDNKGVTSKRQLMQIKHMNNMMNPRIRIGPHCWRGVSNIWLDKSEYNYFNFSQFWEKDISLNVILHFTLWTCVYYLHHYILRWRFFLLYHFTITISPIELVLIIYTIVQYVFCHINILSSNYILYTIYYILYTIYYILYTIYYEKVQPKMSASISLASMCQKIFIYL